MDGGKVTARNESGRFGGVLRALGLAPKAPTKTVAEGSTEAEPLFLKQNGWVPNNEHLPVLLYRGAIEPIPGRPTARFEDTFRRNWWMPQSRNSIYDFQHYHSTAHEVIGICRGEGRVMLGGEGGHELALAAGDVLVLPAGTGHCKIDGSQDFLSVNAYPQDMEWDICKTAPTAEMMDHMRHLTIPRWDPITGLKGSLTRFWPHPDLQEQAAKVS